MNPNGLVAAASITSFVLTSRREHMSANSLASAMLMFRKTFS